MMELLENLRLLQNETIAIVSAVAEKDYHRQFHPDLSPIGWHLGHCVYTESYWVREQLLEQRDVTAALKSLYVPELCLKKARSAALPNRQELIDWARNTQVENCALLESAIAQNRSHKLLHKDYLFHFLIQHYSQHIETMMMVLNEIQIHYSKSEDTPARQLNPKPDKNSLILIEAGDYSIGSDESFIAYDNEQPAHIIKLDSFKIANYPVSNSDYLDFMKSGGYSTREFWSTSGWIWCTDNRITYPHHWQCDNDRWYEIDHRGPHALDYSTPVYGLNYFEAAAYAKWAGARLPHEYEWEVADKINKLQQTAMVWEWCNNTFHSYEGFLPYPYDGYSVPYFDEQHYVLKGGSRYTKKHIKRSAFRNYYMPDKRHIFAGLRLAYN